MGRSIVFHFWNIGGPRKMSDPCAKFISVERNRMYKFKVTHKDLATSTIIASEDQFADTLALVKGWFDNNWITAWSLEGKMSDPSARV
ncbi:MAG: hypothetical protein EBS31_06240 [Burkholderiaceae bacterium]|nr:hypothetical protein [Burkholderiaceae bacterium]